MGCRSKMRHLTGRSVMHALTVGARAWWRRGEKIFDGIFLPEKTFSLFASGSDKGHSAETDPVRV